ncbi:hypothetical protein GLGCALEP_04267 [Pseudomonas sp. MM221]|nr:hypothetical protein DBADOPDK_04159 [Pseudomonas sp. MM223]CAI3807005.1 hypothetical protein GLGCALEP_04267 [Pseudomonas sp. MM221]
MPWYRSGTVAITAGQTTVTGTGTNFSANVRVGDAFTGPDGRSYEVTNTASATVLSILPAYQGATVSAGAYAITPVQGYTKTLADKFNDIANNWGSTLAGLGSVASENVLPVAKGGTGGTTQATARSGIGALGAGDYGLGSAQATHTGDMSSLATSSLFQFTETNPAGWSSGMGTYPMGINFYRSAAVRAQLAVSFGAAGSGAGVYFRQSASGGLTSWSRLLEASEAIGIGQTWKNVTASRALGTTYTNNTGKPIQIAAQAGPASAVNTALIAVVDGISIFTAYAGAAGVYIGVANVIVPPGSTYRVNSSLGTANLTNWSELS